MRTIAVLALLALFGIGFKAAQWSVWEVPNYFPQPLFALPSGERDAQRVALGRMLFFDPILSRDSTISCASCHSPYHAFAHTDHALSHGIDDRMGKRNAPALFNLAWSTHFMWDGAVNHLDVQAIQPITHADEMGETMAGVIKKLKRHAYYNQAFAHCWPTEELESYHVLRVLSLFQSTLISQSSRYDDMSKGVVRFNEMEEKGYHLYKVHCSECHIEPLFASNVLANNGLPVDPKLVDLGHGQLLNDSSAYGLFKVPSLRNWGYSKPYMHDGRFARMHDVLQHYSEGPFNHWTSNLKFQKGLKLTANEHTELMAFLKTLNDSAFVFEQREHLSKDFNIRPKE